MLPSLRRIGDDRGTDDDARRFIDVDELVAMWPNLFLPQRVRAAWEAWLRQRHGAAL